MIMTEAQHQVTQISAGDQLKHLREQKNLSVQDIASRLNLEARIIEAIENNNFELLPTATYTRGYLRSYAKILGVDSDAIVTSYNDNAPEPPEIIPEVKHVTQTSSSDKPVMAITYLITLTLVILLVAWLYSNYVVDKESIGNVDTSEQAEDVVYGLAYEIPVIEHSPLPYYRAAEATGEETDINNETESGVNNDFIAFEDSDEEYPKFVTNDSDGPDSLVLRITTDSWIEIFDSLENRVFVNLGREGQVLALRGTAPFTILLGFAEGVTVEFNGELFDAAPYTKGSIARFSLDN